MITNEIKTVIANTCQIYGLENGFLHRFIHPQSISYFLMAFIVIVIFILIVKYGASINIETLFGKIKIPSMKKNSHAINLCELCRINVTSFVANIIGLCDKIYKMQQKSIQDQIRELDNQFIIESSWINDCHTKMISDAIKLRKDIDEKTKTQIFMKNNQILNFIWLIKKQEIYDYIKNIILLNNFVNKNSIELRFFILEKGKILSASLASGTNLYPDWNDSELLFAHHEYLGLIMEKFTPRIENSLHQILEKCQIIQQKYNQELKNLENEKIKIIEDFKKSLPPKKKEET